MDGQALRIAQICRINLVLRVPPKHIKNLLNTHAPNTASTGKTKTPKLLVLTSCYHLQSLLRPCYYLRRFNRMVMFPTLMAYLLPGS